MEADVPNPRSSLSVDFKQPLHSSSQDGCQYRLLTTRDVLLEQQASLSLDKCRGLRGTRQQYDAVINYNKQQHPYEEDNT